jgi:hypothetical protein
MARPEYTAEGELRRPRGYESWTFAGGPIGLDYSDKKPEEGPGLFHTVYLQPEAYRHYARTGKFPEQTVFVLEVREPSRREVIVKQGYFAGKLVGVAAAVKDHQRFPEGWAYFDFGEAGQEAKAMSPARCHRCHLEHGGDDNAFVQFYPALRELKGTAAARSPDTPLDAPHSK